MKIDLPAVVEPTLRLYGPDVFVASYAVKGRTFRVGLTDGRVFTERHRIVTRIDSTGVLLRNGERIPISPPKSRG